MNKTWIIWGATSSIAQEFAALAARTGCILVLVGRDSEELSIIAKDIYWRYQITCEIVSCDFSQNILPIIKQLLQQYPDASLMIAHSVMVNNEDLNFENIELVIKVNIESTIQLIHAYWQKTQIQHQLLFLSSVAAQRGRAKNSFYGASKAAIEVYLQGLQQSREKNRHITIARLGFIDTKLTYGQPGIFYSPSPKRCAQACWAAVESKKTSIYYPFFWRAIMFGIRNLPLFIFKKLSF